MEHKWVESKLGHGDLMCRICFMTSREAAVLGLLYECRVKAEAPQELIDRLIKQKGSQQ